MRMPIRAGNAYQRREEMPQGVSAFHIMDMVEVDWNNAAPSARIDGATAWYMVSGSRAGSMGAVETVPFSTREAALAFAADFGGEVAAFGGIPMEAVLAFH
ncbi:MAG: nitrous oxide reductase accessory protein NosL [Alphaproteobacteria bacterium]|nr:nitrous oxide reductase accessory protein NosL [Alphaproteobacteria bacterium]MDP6237555.1 nitrous oxide reductase accessory protein NosL [Alphaproteobacteria bacterium]MDP7172953.1 nitrous oxide reductase accessory protein NosL [Alphaproteobacteria bacterium]MDP7234457.1 nitrous oxide reductase accessory protein NosL [Alphaproteobacteria bacterium]MDP7488382.1 nitrous oxide reductase accessory protein NosL [Alphaproteobacteria bacterium]